MPHLSRSRSGRRASRDARNPGSCSENEGCELPNVNPKRCAIRTCVHSPAGILVGSGGDSDEDLLPQSSRRRTAKDPGILTLDDSAVQPVHGDRKLAEFWRRKTKVSAFDCQHGLATCRDVGRRHRRHLWRLVLELCLCRDVAIASSDAHPNEPGARTVRGAHDQPRVRRLILQENTPFLCESGKEAPALIRTSRVAW